MAKSKGFFSKRTGSVGDQTYTILDGKQITKQKISYMTNPQSSKQATQRLRILCAQRFLIAFGNELNHSFESVAVGRKSKQHFLSMAMGTTPVCPMDKGQNGFMPETYVISQGQLPKLEAICTPAVSDNSAKLNRVYNDAVETATLADFVKKNGWEMGDQLTIFAVISDANDINSEKTTAVVDRVILDENLVVTDGVFNFENETNPFTYNIKTGELSFEGDIYDDNKIAGIAVVRTHADQAAGKFRYSSETMDVAESWKTDGATNFGPARASYMKAAKALDSELYMRQAESQPSAEIVYSNPRSYAPTSAAVQDGDEVGLIVDGSDGKVHAVVSDTNVSYGGLSVVEDGTLSFPAIQSMTPRGEMDADEGTQIYPSTATLKWSQNASPVTLGEPVILGAPVKYVDIIDMLINA